MVLDVFEEIQPKRKSLEIPRDPYALRGTPSKLVTAEGGEQAARRHRAAAGMATAYCLVLYQFRHKGSFNPYELCMTIGR